jgi:hypothetical protein
MSLSPPIQIDGHFWVERDGVIIDPHFELYDKIIEIRKCTTKVAHKEAPKSTQDKMIKMYEEYFQKMRGDDWKTVFARVFATPKPNNCVQNAIAEVTNNGGRLVFGSLGWEQKKGGVWWEYGGEDWHTLNDFVVAKRCERCFGENKSGCPCGHARYCSKECQLADWKQHKLVCKTVKK